MLLVFKVLTTQGAQRVEAMVVSLAQSPDKLDHGWEACYSLVQDVPLKVGRYPGQRYPST